MLTAADDSHPSALSSSSSPRQLHRFHCHQLYEVLFLHNLPTLGIVRCFHFCQSDAWEMAFVLGSPAHFSKQLQGHVSAQGEGLTAEQGQCGFWSPLSQFHCLIRRLNHSLSNAERIQRSITEPVFKKTNKKP